MCARRCGRGPTLALVLVVHPTVLRGEVLTLHTPTRSPTRHDL